MATYICRKVFTEKTWYEFVIDKNVYEATSKWLKSKGCVIASEFATENEEAIIIVDFIPGEALDKIASKHSVKTIKCLCQVLDNYDPNNFLDYEYDSKDETYKSFIELSPSVADSHGLRGLAISQTLGLIEWMATGVDDGHIQYVFSHK